MMEILLGAPLTAGGSSSLRLTLVLSGTARSPPSLRLSVQVTASTAETDLKAILVSELQQPLREASVSGHPSLHSKGPGLRPGMRCSGGYCFS